ncbi:bifunctional UDP-sugar hydrolase/5'-nucleotidase UshA [Vibrio salinus]|uniref:bifunctional UDP-sugar hydrolase/5'-nucleotidase UshA n=1 Tax=Vibrio salinus TaxID=2899784 RepID=UPI001E49376B|nr:bifunctional UDP-sugar hydrolase/5'-nucleotidase UshA [Vibrio salinus]MCE0494464.1 bifunctional UDP-sugar hydrolase/5'-nucleotidase UshA [Vibrio salinus]
MIKKYIVVSLLAIAIIGCSGPTPKDGHWQKNQTYHLTVLHTNDHHGRFWTNKYGEYGMAARKTLVDDIRREVKAEGGSVLLFSGGDINTGVPESDMQDAEPDFKGMNKIGYDAMALGNHEFDNPLSVLRKQQSWSNFPFLSANIYDRNTGKRLFPAYKMFNEQGIKIAVIGLTTEDTAKIGNPRYMKDIEFRDPKTEAKKLLEVINQTEQPDLIFAITHMGHYQNGKFGINAPGDVSLARYLNEGAMDMIIGGHSQDPVCMSGPNVINKQFKPGDACRPDYQNGIYIVQAHEWGKYVGRADFDFKNGKLTLVHYALVPVNLKKKIKVNGESKRVFVTSEIPQNKDMYQFLKPYQDLGQASLSEKIGRTDGRLEGDRNVVRFHQTNLGRLIATAQMERTHADFGIMNSGGVRDSIPKGNITYKDVLKVQPFANEVTYVDMRGDELLDYLSVVATKPVDSGAYAQFAGISMQVSNGGVSEVMIDHQPIDIDKMYRFSIPSYNAEGGDGYPNLSGHSGYVNTGYVDAEVLKNYIETHSPLNTDSYAPSEEIIYE